MHIKIAEGFSPALKKAMPLYTATSLTLLEIDLGNFKQLSLILKYISNVYLRWRVKWQMYDKC